MSDFKCDLNLFVFMLKHLKMTLVALVIITRRSITLVALVAKEDGKMPLLNPRT